MSVTSRFHNVDYVSDRHDREMLMQNWVWIMDELISIHRSHDHGISKHIVLVCLMRVEGHQREKKKNRKERDSTWEWEKCVYIKGRSWELNRIAQQSMLSKNMQNNKLCHKTHEDLKCNTCFFTSNVAGAKRHFSHWLFYFLSVWNGPEPAH